MLERLDPDARKIIELSLREALRLGHADIRPEHILLALLRMEKGIAWKALSAEPDLCRDVRGRVIRVLREEEKFLDGKGNVLPICCGQPMIWQEAFGAVRRYECRRRLHHPAVWVDLKTAKHLTDEELPRRDQ